MAPADQGPDYGEPDYGEPDDEGLADRESAGQPTEGMRGIGVERLLAFADAVFAIAITLLALDIQVPDSLDEAEVEKALHAALPDIAAYLLSFVVIGALWLGHHRLFRLIARLDPLLMRLELALLAVIAALPFPTRLISEYSPVPIVTATYAASMATAALLMTLMAVRLRARPRLRHADVTHLELRRTMLESFSLSAVFAASMPLALISTSLAQYSWLLLLPVRRALVLVAVRSGQTRSRSAAS